MSQAQLEKKVKDYLVTQRRWQDYWQRPLTPEQLQAEMERMAQHTKQPEMLQRTLKHSGTIPLSSPSAFGPSRR